MTSAMINGAINSVQHMGWLWLVGWIKLQVSFAKETYKRDAILKKRPIILSILLIVATPYLINGAQHNTTYPLNSVNTGCQQEK